MTWYVWLTLIALLFKMYWWFASSKYTWADTRWYWFMVVLIVQNSSELLSHYSASQHISPESLSLPYFVSLMAAPVAIYAIAFSGARAHRATLSFMVLCCVLMGAAIQFTPYIIAGYMQSSSPITMIKGEYFHVYLLISLALYVVLAGALMNEYVKSGVSKRKLEIAYLIRAFSPFIVVAFYMGGGILLGFEINGSGLFPVASSLFMLVTINQRCRSTYLMKSDPRAAIPLSAEWILSRSIGREIFQFSVGNTSLPAVVKRVEFELFSYSYRKHKGSKSALAIYLGVSRATLDRRIETFESNQNIRTAKEKQHGFNNLP